MGLQRKPASVRTDALDSSERHAGDSRSAQPALTQRRRRLRAVRDRPRTRTHPVHRLRTRTRVLVRPRSWPGTSTPWPGESPASTPTPLQRQNAWSTAPRCPIRPRSGIFGNSRATRCRPGLPARQSPVGHDPVSSWVRKALMLVMYNSLWMNNIDRGGSPWR